MQNAWFAGFESGAQSAKTDGTGSYQGIQIPRQVQEAITQAEMLENSYSGVRKAVVVDMAPVEVKENQSGNKSDFPTQPNIQTMNAGNPALNNVPITNSPSGVTIPGWPAGYDTRAPLPVQPLPFVPAPSR